MMADFHCDILVSNPLCLVQNRVGAAGVGIRLSGRGDGSVTPKEYRFAPFRLDPVNQCLWRGTEQISLSPKAFSVLLYLAGRPGRLVTKQELLDAIWPDIHVTEGVLKRAVLEVRKALADPADEPLFIQTLHRRGYRFVAAGAGQEQRAGHAIPAESGIVGRAREFRQLDAWFENAVESSRQMVFISGEAGLGKPPWWNAGCARSATRTLRWLAADACSSSGAASRICPYSRHWSSSARHSAIAWWRTSAGMRLHGCCTCRR